MITRIPLPTLAEWRSVEYRIRGMVVARSGTVAA